VDFVPVLRIPNRPRRRLVIEDRSGPRRWKKREGKEASGGSFAGTTGKQPRTRTIGGETRVKRQTSGLRIAAMKGPNQLLSLAFHSFRPFPYSPPLVPFEVGGRFGTE
jgi:hypothetical protein